MASRAEVKAGSKEKRRENSEVSGEGGEGRWKVCECGVGG